MTTFSIKNALLLQKTSNIAEYWDSFKPQNNVNATLEDVWKKKVEFMDEVSLQNNVVVFLWNTYTNRILYMSDKLQVLSGLDPALFTAENGIDYSLSLIHPRHVEAAMLTQKAGFNYFIENKQQHDKNFLLCINYLYKNAIGEYIQVLQRGIFLEADENGQPSLCLSFCHYVGHIKKPDSVSCIVSTSDKVIIFDYNLDRKCIEPPKMFSDHEKAIILLLSQGFDTKSISQKLFISPHTVDTHRRNLINKTNCIDTTGVVAFAKLVNLI